MGVASAIISGASNLLGSIFGGVMSNSSSKRIARENRDFALSMYNREQLYNLPINQVQRYRDAGLNPALLYGNIDSGNVTAPKSFENPRRDYSYIERASESFAKGVQMISALKDIDIKKAQEDNIRADTTRKLIENQTFGDMNSQRLSILREQLKQLVENNYWLHDFNSQRFDKGKLENFILQYNADFTPTFLANRASKESKDLAILDQTLKGLKQDYNINSIRRSIMANELLFNKEMLKNRLLGLRLQNNLLSSQGARAVMENKYLPEFLQLRNKSSLLDNNFKNLQNMFKRAIMPFEINKSKYDSNIRRKEDADFYTNRYIKHLVEIIPF